MAKTFSSSRLALSLICSPQPYFFVISLLLSYGYSQADLVPNFYATSCPMAEEIVKSVVEKAVMKEARMAASLAPIPRLLCPEGCDASLLLDNSSTIVTEKGSNPNNNSARGFTVVDQVKSALEAACPKTVSCADILALAARDSVVLSGGPTFPVSLGRRDSRSASLSGSNNNIPAPNSTLQSLISKFKRQGLDVVELVALSRSHTIGQSQCTSFKQRLYNQSGNGLPDFSLDKPYYAELKTRCPKSGGDNNLFPLDFVSPTKFDNYYFKHLVSGHGLLNSDEELYAKGKGKTMEIVKTYAENEEAFLQQFAISMVKLANIKPLTGTKGEIRVNCRRVLG